MGVLNAGRTVSFAGIYIQSFTNVMQKSQPTSRRDKHEAAKEQSRVASCDEFV